MDNQYKVVWGFKSRGKYEKEEVYYRTREDYLQDLSLMIEVHLLDIKNSTEQSPNQYIHIINLKTEKIQEFCNATRKFVLSKDLKLYDEYFRKPGEIPDGYQFDSGEYEGWLQFRWGDGKNAVTNKKDIPAIPVKKEEEKVINPLILSTRFKS